MRQNDAIILKKQNPAGGQFIHLKIQMVNNDAIENLSHYRQFRLEIAPFDLNLDGSFCDEIYKYVLDIFQFTKIKSEDKSTHFIGFGG